MASEFSMAQTRDGASLYLVFNIKFNRVLATFSLSIRMILNVSACCRIPPVEIGGTKTYA